MTTSLDELLLLPSIDQLRSDPVLRVTDVIDSGPQRVPSEMLSLSSDEARALQQFDDGWL